MTFEEANKRVKESISEDKDGVLTWDPDLDEAFDLKVFTGDACGYCEHERDCNLRKYLKEHEWGAVSNCKMWEAAFL